MLLKNKKVQEHARQNRYILQEYTQLIYGVKNQKRLPLRRRLSGKGQEGTFWGDGNTVYKLNLNLRNKTLYVRQTLGA